MLSKKIMVSFLIALSLVASGAIGYVIGYRASNLDQDREITIMYSNLLGERLLELDAIGARIDSDSFERLLQQEKESFILVVGCGKWYEELKNVPSTDLPDFEKAIKLAAGSLNDESKEELSECLATIRERI